MQGYKALLDILKMLSWHMSTDSSNRTFILGVLTAAALAGAYIFWGPSSTGRRKTCKAGKIPGLLNLGKSCFLNAVLQSMASSPTIVKWLGILNAKFNQLQPGEDSITLISSLYRILSVLNGQDCYSDNANAEEVLNALRRNRWAISDDEQDAHEMFHVLTTTIEEELQKEVAVPSLADAARLDDEESVSSTSCSSKCCVNLPSLRRREIQRSIPYRGLLASQLRCKKCSNKSPIKFDTFDSLSLPIPSSQWPELTLSDCLRHFMMPEQVQDVACERCCAQEVAGEGEDDDVDRVKIRSTSVKRLTIGKLPDVLCIHIQRMTWLSNGIPMKQCRHVAFSEYLDMSEFVYSHRPGNCAKGSPLTSGLIGGNAVPGRKSLSNGNGVVPIAPLASTVSQLGLKQNHSSTVSPLINPASGGSCNLFRLQTVIEHLGDVHSGHFMTYRRGALQSPYRNRWFLCSDTAVQEVAVKTVFQCSAYMLLYERICGSIHRLYT